MEAITEAAWNDFHIGYNTVHKLLPLAVLFQFQTGLRAGELCAVRYEDITGNKMYVRRMYRYSEHEVVDFTKGNNPGRIVPLTSDALHIIKTARDYQHKNGLPEDEYVFSVNKEPLSYYALKKIYEKYSLEICGIIKSSHKVRKTFISALLDGGVNLDKVREIAGHADEQTTLNSYCYDRRDFDENIELMENALSNHKK